METTVQRHLAIAYRHADRPGFFRSQHGFHVFIRGDCFVHGRTWPVQQHQVDLLDAELVDAWRYHHPDAREYSRETEDFKTHKPSGCWAS